MVFIIATLSTIIYTLIIDLIIKKSKFKKIILFSIIILGVIINTVFIQNIIIHSVTTPIMAVSTVYFFKKFD